MARARTAPLVQTATANVAIAAAAATLLAGMSFTPAAGQAVGGLDNTVETPEVIRLPDWGYERLYESGVSAERLISDMPVYGITGEEIGVSEDLIMGPDGRILALIAEIGGFWDIGDTHVSIPWTEVEARAGGLVVPVTEDSVGDYSLFDVDYLTAAAADSSIQAGVNDVETGPRAWRISELIGDYARILDGEAYRDWGYVNDVILQDSQIAATVISPDPGYGVGGHRAYPWYGYGAWGWRPTDQVYNMPYTAQEAGEMGRFDYTRIVETP
ncbi:MAG TPA: PRC-barrel domain-containing protein [Devosia sp.]|nr:PRC-barrel domain-containing protein [Devosia sp.]